LRVPLTLALIEGFSVEAGGETFVIPMDAVVECLELPRAKSAANEPIGLLSARGEPVPFVRLRRLFGLAEGAPGREHVVIVRHAGGALGVAVDALIGSRQMVIKPL